VGGFIYLLRKIVPDALRSRRENIERELREAREAKDAADAKLAEYKRKVANLEAEIEKIKADFKGEGELQFKRILAEAEQAAETLRRNAVAAGEREGRQAAEQLRTEAVEQALALATQILAKAYGEADQKTALQKTIEKIEGLH
jgi:F-type H+-transporting ATPase subunit b